MAYYDNLANRRKGKHGSDLYKLDTKNKTPEENIRSILNGLYIKKPFQNDTSATNRSLNLGLRNLSKTSSDSRKLSYLNALGTLLGREDRNNLGFTPDELMTCLRISLVDESVLIRAAALRVLRYLIRTESDVATFNNLKISYLIIRSLDLMLRNEEERAQALRVVRRVVAVAGATGLTKKHRASYVDPGLLRCLYALARAGSAADGTGDRLSKPAIALLAEICVLNPDLFISCGGVNAVTRQLGECATPRMAEALCGVLLHTLNHPKSRRAARIDLMCLSAPYSDFHFRPAGTETSRDEREMRFTCSRLALLCVLRSWPGLLHFCHPHSTGGLRSLVAALYLPRLEVRKAILDLLYELVGLPQPEWTDEISVALAAVDPSDYQDSWRLSEGFVADEGIAILPHLGTTGPDISEIHLALLLQCFLEVGLLDGLAEVIVTSDTFISVRATVLLGQLLHLSHLLLPPQICNVTPALPSLISQATAGRPQALAAIAALRSLHSMLEARPATSSLYLDHIVQYCSGAYTERPEDTTKSKKEKDNASMAKPKPDLYKDNSLEFLDESDHENEPKRHSVGSRADLPLRNVSALPKSKSMSSRTNAAVSKVSKTAKFLHFRRDCNSLIRATLVMQSDDGKKWDWEIIRAILKESDSTPLLDLSDNEHKIWALRLVAYLKPCSNKYSHTDLTGTGHGHAATRAGCQLIRHLLAHPDAESQRMLEDLFQDVSHQIKAIDTGLRAHECLFSPQHMSNTMCQMYFLFVGQLCHSQAGLKLFKQMSLYENLLELSTKTHHSCYVKLVISSLDYTLDSYPRDILAKTLTCNNQSSRLYSTQFLNVLLRASRKSREIVRRKAKLKKSFEYIKPHRTDDDADGEDMEMWILQMLVRQLKDECKDVVQTALGILEEAFTVPAFVEKLITMRDTLCQNCRLDKNAEPSTFDFNAVGDRGYLIWLSLEIAASSQTADAKSLAFIKKHLDFWTYTYNYRYVNLVESAIHDALTMPDGGGRGSYRWRRTARPAPHLHAALARYQPARARSLLANTLPTHYRILQRKKCESEQEIGDLKATLWAIGNTAVTPQGLQLLMGLSNEFLEDSVLVHVVRLAKYCPVYGIRATAFYILSIIGSTYDGANLLADLGWLCVRHTRHDQFPIIPDETYSLYDGDLHCFVTSPERFNPYDAEASEHSDHTDQSIAESLPSDTKITKDIDKDVVDGKLLETNESKRKSHTLPIQSCSSNDRPMLSESRTIDILPSFERPPHRMQIENRLVGKMNSLEQAHEGRVRNTSESSTSGVSSCDSFLGKYAIPDRVWTLSPIPSSSSLYGTKINNSSQRQKVSELQRRTSTSSFAGNEIASSPPSQLDMTGYATLKSLNRRPHIKSESAATGSSEIDELSLSWVLEDSRRHYPFSSLRDRTRSHRERMYKMSLLEYDWKPLPFSEDRAGVARRSAAPAPAPLPPAARPPAYIGICLPRDLMELFPRDEECKDAEPDKGEQSKCERLPSFLADTSIASNDKSRTTPDSQKLSYSRGINNVASTSINVRGTFAASSTPISAKTKPDAGSKTDVSSDSDNNAKDKTQSQDSIDKSDETAKNDSSSSDVTKTEDIPKGDELASDKNAAPLSALAGSSGAQGRVWQHAASECLACARVRPPSAHQLREAFFAGIEASSVEAVSPTCSSSPVPENHTTHGEILHHVHFMANPIHLRQTRSALLTLKQRYPDVFCNPCLYSDVCCLLARSTYMLCARRFIQELFLDVTFECFSREPAAIIATRCHDKPR